VGNPNLKPESAKEYEGGIEQKIAENGFLKLSGFDRKVTDLIQWDWSVFPMQVENIGSARIRGYAAEAGYDLSGAFSALINYTYTNPVDQSTGEKIYTIPKSEVKGILTFFPEKTVYLTLQGRSVRNYVAPGESRWQYSVMDAKIAEKMWKTGEFFLMMTNVFDRDYEVVKGYPMAPREIFAGITAQF
jgi:outer membrane cobalamin receptor